jgi:hypothetical protein
MATKSSLNSEERKILMRQTCPSQKQFHALQALRRKFQTAQRNFKPYMSKRNKLKADFQRAKRSLWEWMKVGGQALEHVFTSAGVKDGVSHGPPVTGSKETNEEWGPIFPPPKADDFYSSSVPGDEHPTSQGDSPTVGGRGDANAFFSALDAPDYLSIVQQRKTALKKAQEEFDRHKRNYKLELIEYISSQMPRKDTSANFLDEFGPMYMRRGQKLTRRLTEAEAAYNAARVHDQGSSSESLIEEEEIIQVPEEVALILEEFKPSKVEQWLEEITPEYRSGDTATSKREPKFDRRIAKLSNLAADTGWNGSNCKMSRLQFATGDVEPLPKVRKRGAVDDISPGPWKRHKTEGKEFEAQCEPLPEEATEEFPDKNDHKWHVDDDRWDSISATDGANNRAPIIDYARRQRRGYL